MEGRAHPGKASTLSGQKNRMMDDLTSYSENLIRRFKQRLPPAVKSEPAAGTETHRTFHVGIVGAGLAGLRCAEVLIQEGIAVTLIEARGRLGGRIHQSSLLGQLVDMGPNWIHGTDDNPVVKLAENVNGKLISPNESTYVYDSAGMLMNAQKVLNADTTFWDILADAFKYSDEDCKAIAPNLSLKDYFIERLSASQLDKEAQNTVMELAEMWGGFIGDPFERQSLKWFWLEECLEGENLFVSNTHRAIINRTAEAALSCGDVHLSTIVQSIEARHEGKGAGRVVVKTANRNFSFDAVVVTIPLGCLKMGTLQFVPELPQNVHRAIKDTSFSRLEKAFLAFPAPFWESSNMSAFKGEETTRATENTFPMFTRFLRASYVPEEQSSWTLEMVALSSPTIFGDDARPLLMFCLWGASAAHMTSAIASLNPSSDEYYKVMDILFRPFYSRLPNYKEGHPECVPTEVLATNWQNDEFAGRGSYTNFKTHLSGEQSNEDPAIDDHFLTLRHGLPERGIWFAGEHTAPFVALGTSTGAYWSGESAATRIIEAYMLSRQPHSG